VCGIAGIIGPPDEHVSPLEVRRALTEIRHRGPDDEGYVLLATHRKVAIAAGGDETDRTVRVPHVREYAREAVNVVLGHRRLSILDLSNAGHQPMASRDRTCWIVFNGEIYNYLELRNDLRALGHEFATESDTEVVLAAYRQWGRTMLPKLIGMFAFVIVNVADNTVLAARDPFGIKPLYYCARGRQWAFASEIKALMTNDRVGRSVDPQRLYEYLVLALTDFGERTCFAAVRQVRAGHFMFGTLDRLREMSQERYWKIDLAEVTADGRAEATDQVRAAVRESVRLHMRSDVPVGACLSGGLDSSIVVSCMRDSAGPSAGIHTFTFVTEDPQLGEEAYADLVSDQERTVRHKTRPTPEEMAAELDTIVFQQDEPFRSTSIYAQYRVFGLARQAGVKVVLDGQGADELFGGYLSCRGAHVSGLVAQGRLGAALRAVRTAPRSERRLLPGMIGTAFGRLAPDCLVRPALSMAGRPRVPEWLNGGWCSERNVSFDLPPRGRGKEALRRELWQSVETSSLPQLLRYEDRNSMAHSVESRVPFCNVPLARVAFSLPADYLMSRDGVSKAVLRAAFENVLPKAVLEREKVGFAVPEVDWLTALRPWLRRCLADVDPASLPFLNWRQAAAAIAPTVDGRGSVSGVPWRLLNVVRWMARFSVVADS